MMQLSMEQIEAIDAGDAVPISVDDTPCVVVRQDIYERLLPQSGSEIPPEAVGGLVRENMADYDAGDPLLDSYQEAR